MNIENARKIIDDSTTMTAVEVLAFTEAIEQLAEAKRLLKSATNVLKRFKPCDEDYDCSECIHQRRNCDYDDRFKWRYADEAEKLLNG